MQAPKGKPGCQRHGWRTTSPQSIQDRGWVWLFNHFVPQPAGSPICIWCCSIAMQLAYGPFMFERGPEARASSQVPSSSATKAEPGASESDQSNKMSYSAAQWISMGKKRFCWAVELKGEPFPQQKTRKRAPLKPPSFPEPHPQEPRQTN